MNWTAVERRLVEARDLPVLLDAAYAAFEAVLSAIEEQEDPTDPRFITFLAAGTCAANGRDAILFAPSLPSRQLPRPLAGNAALPDDMPDVADAAVAICALLTTRLTQAGKWCADAGDQAGCADAAACARQIQQLLTGGEP